MSRPSNKVKEAIQNTLSKYNGVEVSFETFLQEVVTISETPEEKVKLFTENAFKKRA